MSFTTLIATTIIPWALLIGPDVQPVNWPSQQAFDQARALCHDVKMNNTQSGQNILFSLKYGCHRIINDPRGGQTEIVEQFDGINDGTQTSL